MDNQTKKKSSIAFIVELFMMFAILLLVITVITQIFVMTRGESLKARHLTEAVIAAESTAEVLSASENPKDAAVLLGGMENASDVKESEDGFDLKIRYGGKERTGDVYDVNVTEDREKTSAGTYISRVIKVYLDGSELYTLTSGDYDKEAE